MFEKMLQDVVTTYGPTGHEQAVSDCIRGYVAPWCDEVKNDALGNLIAFKKGTSGKKIMLSAHMDQIGLIVTDIDEEGFLRVSNMGGVSPVAAVGRQYVFGNGTRGVTYFETEKKTLGQVAFPELFMDVGATSREEAEKLVEIGDVAVYTTDYAMMGKRLTTAYLDNRVSCAVIMESLRTAKTVHDLYVVFTVQEEVGCRGAGAAAYAIDPDLAINLDVTGIGDTPKCARMRCGLGKGPTVKVLDGSVVVAAPVRALLRGAAEKNGIPYQNEVLRAGGTDTGVIQRTKAGIPAGCISIPTRYIHSQVETCDMDDVKNAVRLVNAVLEMDELPALKA